MNEAINRLINVLWCIFLISYIIFIFVFIGKKDRLSSLYGSNGAYYCFCLLAKAITKTLLYGIEAVIIGLLLSLLTTNPKDIQNISNDEMFNILKFIFKCFPLITTAVWLIDLLNLMKEKYNREVAHYSTFFEKYVYVIIPGIGGSIVCFVEIGIGNNIGGNNLTIGNWISICSIIVSLLIAISSWIYTAYTTWKNNRPFIVITMKHYRLANTMNRFLSFQNTGKTIAKVNKISAVVVNSDKEKIPIDLSIWKNFTCAPNQHDTYYLKDGLEGKLTISVEYTRVDSKHVYKDTFEYNLNKERDIEFRVNQTESKEIANYLCEIARGLQEIKGKL